MKKKNIDTQIEAARKCEAAMRVIIEEGPIYRDASPIKREGVRNLKIWLIGMLRDIGAGCPKFAETSSSKRTLEELAAMTASRHAKTEKQKAEAKAARARARARPYPPTVEERLAVLEGGAE